MKAGFDEGLLARLHSDGDGELSSVDFIARLVSMYMLIGLFVAHDRYKMYMLIGLFVAHDRYKMYVLIGLFVAHDRYKCFKRMMSFGNCTRDDPGMPRRPR